MACIYQGLFPGVASGAPSDPRGDLSPCTVSPVDPFSAVPAVSAFLRYFAAPAVSPPRQYFPSRINAAISGKTLISEPRAIR